MIEFFAMTLFPMLVLAAAIGDLLTMRIPNWLNAITAVSVLPMAALLGMPLEVLQWHLMAGAVMLVIGFALFSRGYLGGGDAKLMAAAGLWVGWTSLLPFVLVMTLAGGVLAVLYKLWELVRADDEVRGAVGIRRLFRGNLQLPYGVAIATGALWVYPGTWWIERLL